VQKSFGHVLHCACSVQPMLTPTWQSPAPTLARMASNKHISASSQGTKQPICAIRTATPTCRMYVDFPPMFGPAHSPQRHLCSCPTSIARGVTRLEGARGKQQVLRPIFEPEVFRKQMYCIEGSTCDIVGTFRRPSQSFGARCSDSAPGELSPFATLPYAPENCTKRFPKD